MFNIACRKALAPLEQFIMEFVWTHPGCTAETCREGVAGQRTLKDSTIRTVLRNLEKKGYVAHEVDGRTFVYRAVDTKRNVAVQAARQLIERLCGGSVEELLVGLVDNQVLEPKQLQRLAEKIAARKGEEGMTSVQLLAEWTIRSSILILSGGVLMWALRVKDASIRLAAWTAILCGSPAIPVLSVALPKVPVEAMRPVVRQVELIYDAAPVRESFAQQPVVAVSEPFDWVRAGLIAYGPITFVLLARLFAGWALSLRLLRRSRATEHAEIRESDVVASPVTLGIVRPTIVLPGDWREWDGAKLEAVLAHERSHIRRRDPAVQMVSAIHRALLWHSPLSWFLHRRIVRVAEEVSDDAAVAVTRDRASYAEVLLDFMRHGVRGANWQGVPMARYGRADQRIHRILDATKLSRGLTLWSVVFIAALGGPPAYVVAAARPQSAAPVARQKFEVASIRLCKPGESAPGRDGRKGGPGGGVRSSPGRLHIGCEAVEDLIRFAYLEYDQGKALPSIGGFPTSPVSARLLFEPIKGSPAWVRSEKYTIEAKAPDTQSMEMMRGPMMQGLLENRFKLKIHRETRDVPVYLLTVAKGGAKLQATKEGSCAPVDLDNPRGPRVPGQPDRPGCGWWAPDKNGEGVDSYGQTMAGLCMQFSGDLDRDVIDKTGITGAFDIHLDTAFPGRGPDPFGEISVALRKLGLKLESAKGSGEFLVIDSIQRPTAN